jgi:rifampicin phosphotransferase
MPVPAIASHDRARVARIGTGAPLAADRAGGKGASLDRLTRSGWAVPPAACITADAFRDQLAAVARRVPLDELTAALPAPEARAAIVAAFEATPTVPALRDSIAAAVADLVHDLESLVGGADAASGDRAAPPEAGPATFAIRSSALDEDGAVASFAGLHETELGRTADEVEPAVRRCWASLWSIPAISYRFRRALPVDDLAMAVVVQALVPADASAVVFTRHPVTGRDDHVLLTTVRGLGEPMVSGDATPDTIVVDRASRRVLELSPGRPGMRQFVERGRIVERLDPLSTPVLTDSAVAELVDLALAVETAAGHPVDVEAARAGGTWFLLQSRPITTR